MTSSSVSAARQIQRQELQPEPVGNDWLEDFRHLFADEFPEDEQARIAVEERNERVQAPRPGRKAP